MARAFIGSVECQVQVDKDLGDNWAVTVLPPRPKKGEQALASRVVKLQGEDRDKATAGGLEILQKHGSRGLHGGTGKHACFVVVPKGGG